MIQPRESPVTILYLCAYPIQTGTTHPRCLIRQLHIGHCKSLVFVNLESGLIEDKLNIYCPEKTVRISSQDKAWITSELKKVDRLKKPRIYKECKTKRYKEMSKIYKENIRLKPQNFSRQILMN